VQGVLGIFRVSRISTELAALHGCLAQLVFATLVCVAVLASRTWSLPASTPRSLRLGGLILCGLVYVQIVFGALTRHLSDPLAQRLHVLLAFAAFGVTTWLLGKLHRRSAEVSNPAARRLSFPLAVFIVLQPILGVEAWVRRFGSGTLPELLPSDPTTDLIRSGHHVLGTLIFTTTAALAVLLCRPRAAVVPQVEQPANASADVPTPLPSETVNVCQLEGSA
jgi:cytochrome c oxidase assembly protein subunit 15